jgi:RNA polymerase sigma factor (sigma-70 family)
MVSLDVAVRHGDENAELFLRDIIPSGEKRPDSILIEEEDRVMLDSMIQSPQLTDQQRKYINDYYLDNMTLQQIADEAGSSREAVRQTIERGMTKIRRLGEVYDKR